MKAAAKEGHSLTSSSGRLQDLARSLALQAGALMET